MSGKSEAEVRPSGLRSAWVTTVGWRKVSVLAVEAAGMAYCDGRGGGCTRQGIFILQEKFERSVRK